jgi:pyruvate kinase
VLETLNKSGVATSYAAQSECVMLNKGNYIINVMKTLSDIPRRSGGHHARKDILLDPTKIASDYLSSKDVVGHKELI